MINEKNRHSKGKLIILLNNELVEVDCVYEYDMTLDQTFTNIKVCDGVNITIYNDAILESDRELRQ